MGPRLPPPDPSAHYSVKVKTTNPQRSVLCMGSDTSMHFVTLFFIERPFYNFTLILLFLSQPGG